MATIDVGPGSQYYAAALANFTNIAIGNSANDTGTLDTFIFWVKGNTTSFKIGTFYISGSNYAIRDYETIGNVSAGSEQTFTGKNCEVSSGDKLGCYGAGAGGGACINTTTGEGRYYILGDYFGQAPQSYSVIDAGQSLRVYATGATAGSLPLKNVFGRPFSGVFR